MPPNNEMRTKRGPDGASPLISVWGGLRGQTDEGGPGMIIGAHSIIYSKNPEADRGFLRDVLKLPHVDAHGGWLIFGLPPSEVAVHPSDKNDTRGWQEGGGGDSSRPTKQPDAGADEVREGKAARPSRLIRSVRQTEP